MINNKTPPNRTTLPGNTKQAVLLSILQRNLRQQDYLSKIYLQEIQLLMKQKKQMQERFNRWQNNYHDISTVWNHQTSGYQFQNIKTNKNMNTSKLFLNNNSKMDQSLYMGDSPSKTNGFGKKLNQSPIRKLQSSKIIGVNKTIQKKNFHQNTSFEKHYSKIEQIQKQITQISSRIFMKQQKLPKIFQDQISQNLLKKIQQQQNHIKNQISRWKDLQIKRRAKLQINQKIQRIKQEIFKQNQSLKTITKQKINRNKQIIKKGYTQKMLEVIAAYGGIRK